MLGKPHMHLNRRILAGLPAALALAASHAKAQPAPPPPPPPAVSPPSAALPPPAPLPPPSAAPAPTPEPAPSVAVSAPETLEIPYIDPPSPPAKKTAAAARKATPAVVDADKRPPGAIRSQRKLALLGELGWNGLAGFGAVLTYNPDPHVALDLAGGFSLLGWKGGVRGRYNLFTSNFTPFVGAGFNATSGLGEITSDPKDDPDRDADSVPFTLDIKASYLVQGVVGFDFIHRRGFTMVGCLGYAHLLNKNNVAILNGKLTRNEQQAVNIVFKSGLVISLAMGYAFE